MEVVRIEEKKNYVSAVCVSCAGWHEAAGLADYMDQWLEVLEVRHIYRTDMWVLLVRRWKRTDNSGMEHGVFVQNVRAAVAELDARLRGC